MVSDNALSRFSALVDQQTGLYFPETRYADLQRTLALMAKENGFDSADSCLHWLLSAPHERNRQNLLIKYLTVGETYFLRDRPVFDCLQDTILPERITACQQRAEPRLKIWSAACASGEEPYSIAITVDQATHDRHYPVAIMATDINNEQLQKARSGLYSQWSFRSAPDWLRNLYFSVEGGNQFRISQRIIDMVSFTQLNLARPDYPPPFADEGAFDVIFCRNVLMYFAPLMQQRIITALCQRLAPGGWLIVSPCEAGIVQQTELRSERITDFLFFRKITSPAGNRDTHPLSQSPAVMPPLHGRASRPAEARRLPAATAAPSPQQTGTPALAAKQRKKPSSPRPLPQTVAARELFQQAQEFYRSKHFEQAESLLRRLLNNEPGMTTDATLTGQAFSLLARINGDQGRLEMAEELHQQALLADKLNPDHYFNVAMICQELGDCDRAVYNMRKVIYLEPDFIMAHFHLGILAKKAETRRRHLTIACDLLAKVDQEAHLPFADEMIAGKILEMAKAMLHRAG